jgi:cytochrome c oxidase subunit III
MPAFAGWWLATIALGAIFIGGTALEWRNLIYANGLTVRTNLFGTTYYALVGLHAVHVIVGLALLALVAALASGGHVKATHAERGAVLSLYWHFVDCVWVVVFMVVYVIAR